MKRTGWNNSKHAKQNKEDNKVNSLLKGQNTNRAAFSFTLLLALHRKLPTLLLSF